MEVSLHDDLGKDYVGILQRVKCIPVNTERGIQVQRSAAHMAFQEILDFDTVNLSGFITVLERSIQLTLFLCLIKIIFCVLD